MLFLNTDDMAYNIRQSINLWRFKWYIHIKLYFRPIFVNISLELVTLEEHLNTGACISMIEPVNVICDIICDVKYFYTVFL